MFHAQALGHLVRRGLESTATISSDVHVPTTGPDWDGELSKLSDRLSPIGMLLVVLTIFGFAVVLVAVRYTLMGVVATLAQVETPTGAYMPLDRNENDARKPSNTNEPPPYEDDEDMQGTSRDPEAVLVPQPLITSSIRGTIRHIHGLGGFLARWRGFWPAVCTVIAYSFINNLVYTGFVQIMPYAVAIIISGVLTQLILARWYMAWTHVVISEPSSKPWYRRIPSFASWRKISAPTAIVAFATQAAFVVPAVLFVVFGMTDMERVQGMSPWSLAWKGITVMLIDLVLWLLIVLPAEVALTRCQASLLPEEDETIVPFDRTFGGKVVPEIIGGSGMVSFVDAWKSFDRPARIRLIKLYAKIIGIDIALQILCGVVLSLEFLAVITDAGKHGK